MTILFGKEEAWLEYAKGYGHGYGYGSPYANGKGLGGASAYGTGLLNAQWHGQLSSLVDAVQDPVWDL